MNGNEKKKKQKTKNRENNLKDFFYEEMNKHRIPLPRAQQIQEIISKKRKV
jgi:hypothetical protein